MMSDNFKQQKINMPLKYMQNYNSRGRETNNSVYKRQITQIQESPDKYEEHDDSQLLESDIDGKNIG